MASRIDEFQSSIHQISATIAHLEDELDSKTMKYQEDRELHQETKTKLDMLTQEMNEILVKNLQLMTELSDNKSTIISLRKQTNRLENNADIIPSADTSRIEPLAMSSIESAAAAAGNNDKELSFTEPFALQSSEAMSSELESLRNKCSILEMEISTLKKEQQSRALSDEQAQSISTSDSEHGNAERKKQKRTKQESSLEQEFKTLSNIPSSISSRDCDCEIASSKSSSSTSSDSSDTESMHRHRKQNNDRHILSALAHENQTLKQKISELEADLEKRRQSQNESEPVPWMQNENKKLLDLLNQAERDAENNQVQERVTCIKNRVKLIDHYVRFFSNMHRTLGRVLFDEIKY